MLQYEYTTDTKFTILLVVLCSSMRLHLHSQRSRHTHHEHITAVNGHQYFLSTIICISMLHYLMISTTPLGNPPYSVKKEKRGEIELSRQKTKS